MGVGALAAGVFGAAVFLVGSRRTSGKTGSWERFPLWACLLFLGAFLFRLVLGYGSEGFTTDTDTFKSWASILNDVGFRQIYQQDIFLDYPPGYLYVLLFLEKLRLLLGLPLESQGYTLLIKLPSILADLFCAWVLLRLALPRLGERPALLVSAAYLFCPAVYLNSAQWGQADSFCTAIVLGSVLLLERERFVPSAILFGAAIACKPQMLVFAPLYFFFTVRRKKWGKLLLGVVLALATVLLIALPYTINFNFLWLLERYQATLAYYNYYSVNAYNFWSLIGWNWKTLPGGLLGSLLNLLGPVIATILCGVWVFRSKDRNVLFFCPALLMAVMYAFSVKMHERYLFPALLFTLLSFLFTRDRGFLRALACLATASYANVAYVLWQFQEFYGSYNPNTWLTFLFSLGQMASIGYLIWVGIRVFLLGKVKEGEPHSTRPLADTFSGGGRLPRQGWILALAVTVLYACFAFYRLGDTQTAVTPWTPQSGDSVVLTADGDVDTLIYLPGIAPDDAHYTSRVGVNVLVETSQDGDVWTDCGTLTDGSVFCWKEYRLTTPGRYVRLTALDGSVTLNEAGLRYTGIPVLATVTGDGDCEALLDEQDRVPLETTYENSTYFDEIYHARTAYEHILGLEPYENTHPTLGKLIISLGIRIFGMNPFGWRFMGALFGVLMLPVLYHLLWQLFGKTRLCLAGTVLFAFDFMHFTQTRIATIDTYAVFFLLLMYDAMLAFLKRDLLRDGWNKLLPPLLLCGVFTGLGIASKWTAAYGALGLAGLYFGKLVFTWLDARRSQKGGKETWKPLLVRMAQLCGWCCLFFIALPLGIYFCAFLPVTTLPHNVGKLLWAFWNYQVTMFTYHANLVATHTFSSPWYEWPFDIRPIWYFAGDTSQGYSTISALGNPLLWWAGIPALAGTFCIWWREHSRWAGLVLAGFGSVYLPWVLVPRLTFIYHYFTAVPFLVIALCGVFFLLDQRAPFSRELVLPGGVCCRGSTLLLAAFTVGCLVLFALYFPVISGSPTTRTYANALELFETWYFA
ncbi:MAG: glycosyltransferase family 39 protein [Acutalibacter sp.]|jgi:dolichyl-phosphate-mannose-protein mannosyltransferase